MQHIDTSSQKNVIKVIRNCNYQFFTHENITDCYVHVIGNIKPAHLAIQLLSFYIPSSCWKNESGSVDRSLLI
jgi:hypothetical protein